MKKKSIFLLIIPFSSVQFFPWMFSKVDELSFVCIYCMQIDLLYFSLLTWLFLFVDVTPEVPSRTPQVILHPVLSEPGWVCVILSLMLILKTLTGVRFIGSCFKWDFWIWTLKSLFYCTFSNLHNLTQFDWRIRIFLLCNVSRLYGASQMQSLSALFSSASLLKTCQKHLTLLTDITAQRIQICLKCYVWKQCLASIYGGCEHFRSWNYWSKHICGVKTDATWPKEEWGLTSRYSDDVRHITSGCFRKTRRAIKRNAFFK